MRKKNTTKDIVDRILKVRAEYKEVAHLGKSKPIGIKGICKQNHLAYDTYNRYKDIPDNMLFTHLEQLRSKAYSKNGKKRAKKTNEKRWDPINDIICQKWVSA
jgi:benzoyl-CoA reductase/2-hydroxyglutaryl-CoA dehydratase subunit BcrC/BadD/HgdB